MITTGVLFCTYCGSQLIDVVGWKTPEEAVIQCCNCEYTSTINGFTIGRCHVSENNFINAANDTALYANNHKTKELIHKQAKAELSYSGGRS